MKLRFNMLAVMGFAILQLAGCASTNTNAEFSCKLPGKTRCEPLSQVNARISLDDSDLDQPFNNDTFWER